MALANFNFILPASAGMNMRFLNETNVNVTSDAAPANPLAFLGTVLSDRCVADIEAAMAAAGSDDGTDEDPCTEPKTQVDVCVVGKEDECEDLQAGLDYTVCVATGLGEAIDSLDDCTTKEAVDAATLLATTLWAGATAACGGEPVHVCITSGAVDPEAAFEAGLEAAAGNPEPEDESAAAGLIALAGVSLAAASMLA